MVVLVIFGGSYAGGSYDGGDDNVLMYLAI
jgi:hypothetical protein